MLKRKQSAVEEVDRAPRMFDVEDPVQVQNVANELMQPGATAVVELVRLSSVQQLVFKSYLDGMAMALNLHVQKITGTRFEYKNVLKSANID